MCPLPGAMALACYVDDAAGEVHEWFCVLANSHISSSMATPSYYRDGTGPGVLGLVHPI